MTIADISDGESGADVRTKLNAVIAAINAGWTEVVLGSDVTNDQTTNANITGLAFTPAANKTYDIEFDLIVSAAANTTGVEIGATPPGGTAVSVVRLLSSNGGTAGVLLFGTTNDSTNVKATNADNSAGAANNKFLTSGRARVIAGATPSGDFQLTVSSEVSGSTVTVHARSSLRYREVA